MSKIVSILILILFSLNANAAPCYDKHSFRKIFFLNGIANDNKDRKIAIERLQTNFEIENIKSIPNETDGYIKDISQVFTQIDVERQRQKISESQRNKIILGDTDLDAKFYLKYLDPKKKNFIIAHSQGNLFTNAMCDLKDEDLHMEVFSIAPPTESLKCNPKKNYVLFKNDFVINLIKLQLPDFKQQKPTHIDPDFSPKEYVKSKLNDISAMDMIHHTLDSYLKYHETRQYLKNKIETTINKSYEDYANNLELARIEFKPDNIIDKAKNSINGTTESVDLWMRENKAFLNSSTFVIALLDPSNFQSKKGIKKLLNTKIPAENEQEFADMIAYSLNKLASICNKSLTGELKSLCNDLEIKDYFNKKEKFDPYFTALHVNDDEIVLNCKNAVALYDSLRSKSIEVKVHFQKETPDILYNKENLDVKLYSDKNFEVAKTLGFLELKKEKEEYLVNFKAEKTEEPLNNSLAQDQFKECDTLAKLGSNKCVALLKSLKSKYFSYYK